MKLNEETLELINRLHGKKSLRDTLRFGHRNSKVELIEKIADEPRSFLALPAILPFLFDCEKLEVAARKAISKILSGVDSKQLVYLDKNFRSTYSHYCQDWWQLNPDVISRFSKGIGEPELILGLFSFHPSGYVREKAVKLMSEIDTGKAYPFLLLRVNDWVDQVSELARSSIKVRLGQANLKEVINSLPLFSRLAELVRRDNKDVLEMLSGLIHEPSSVEALITAFEHPDRLVRRMVCKTSMEIASFPFERIIDLALSDNDTVVRSLAARSIRRVSDRNRRIELCNTKRKKILDTQ